MAPAKSRKRKSGQDRVADEAAKESSIGKSLPVRAKDGEPPAPVKGTLKVFGAEDEAEAPKTSSSSAAPKKVEEKQIEDSDDDEAPEAVSTHQAALSVKKSAHATQKAAKEQAEAQKRKRQHRDELFKQQAEERKKAEEAAKEAEAAAAAESQSQDGDDTIARHPEITSGRRRMDRLQIPAVLPAEFLTDSSSESEDDELTSANAGPKRRKVSGVEKRLSRQDRGPRDEIVGSTVYRVATKTDERLAPKLKKYARSSKDGLLKRNRSAVKPKSGFTMRK